MSVLMDFSSLLGFLFCDESSTGYSLRDWNYDDSEDLGTDVSVIRFFSIREVRSYQNYPRSDRGVSAWFYLGSSLWRWGQSALLESGYS